MLEVVQTHQTVIPSDRRIIHHIVLGIDQEAVPVPIIDMAVEKLKIDITRLTGGVTVIKGQGTWALDAEAGIYSGPFEHDVSVNIILTVTPDEGRKVWPKISAAIRTAVRRFALGCEHIHVMAWEARSRIFSISGKGDAPKALPAPQRASVGETSDV